ncbi:MAG: BUG/TctC family periplasmic protein [uncultured Acetobacteraceae bacterium]|uniref:BUG/TctC family periplasmic protein n=1 Tax=uncultured Acetobacteraceae bacterium TaxID=169975 RepID=A0A6J4ICG6_9PROT|nr:MAG: BUG/TctC family periplasmic protein [uncultured Acetobacteraceae bacterium]
MQNGRRSLLASAAGAVVLATAARAQPAAGAWPSRPIRLVVPYAAGGGTDILARALAEALRPSLPQPLVVENRAGAAGVVGSEAVARAEPDGHSLLVVVSTHVLNRHHMAQLPYDPIRDFAPIAMLTRNSMVLAAGTAQPFADLRGMLERARREPGRVGTGSTEALSAFIGQELARRAGLDTPDVQYRSGGQLMNDIVAGHLPVGWTSTASVTPHVPTGRIRVLATASASRTPFFPEAPTLAEAGVPGIALSGWVALLGPAALPPAIAERLHALLRPVFDDANFRQRLGTLGIEPDLRQAEALREEMLREDAYWAAAARAGTLKPQG